MEAPNEENHLNFEKLCRCCLEESDDLRSLFKEGLILGYTTTLKDVLQEFTPISITEDDDLPQKICYKCVIEASRSFIFHHTCMKSNSTLRDYLVSAGIKTKSELEYEKLMGDGTLYFLDNLYESDDENFTDRETTIENVENTEGEHDYINESENDGDLSETSDNKNDNKEIIDNVKSDIPTYSILSDEQEDDVAIITEEYPDIEDMVEENDEEIDTIKLEIKNTINSFKDEDEHSNSTVIKSENSTIQSQNTVLIKTENIFHKKRKQRLRKLVGPPYKCEICGKLLSTHSSYNYHKQLHSDKTPFLCSECGQGFKTRNAYDGHMTTHAGGHKCKICDNTYRQISSLKTHMLMHTGERPFVCQVCGKGMTQKSGYKKHMLTHTGEKPFQCEICQKDFRYSSNLIAHKKSHAGYKSYVCEICEKSFVTNEQLKRHTLIHSGSRPFDCKDCGKVFNRKSSLAVHMNLHSGNRKHVCEICGKSYIQLQALQSHMKSHSDNNKIKLKKEQQNDVKSEEILIEEIQQTTDAVLEM